jgi:hypothetical protein
MFKKSFEKLESDSKDKRYHKRYKRLLAVGMVIAFTTIFANYYFGDDQSDTVYAIAMSFIFFYLYCYYDNYKDEEEDE